MAIKIYLLLSVLFFLLIRIPPPEFLQIYWLLIEFSPRWLVFIPLLFVRWWQLKVKSLIMLVSISVFNVFLVCGFTINTSQNAPVDESFSMITFNMGTDVAQAKQVALVFLEHEPDIMLLQESEEKALRDTFPADIGIHCNKGLCVVTRHQIEIQDFLSRRDTGSWGTFAAKYSLRVNQCDISIVNIHPDTPRFTLLAAMKQPFSGYSQAQDLYFKRSIDHIRLSSWLDESTVDVVAGDFNTTIHGAMYQQYWASFENAFNQAGQGFGMTYHEKGFSTRIDHVIHTQKLDTLSAEVLSDTGTSHRPLAARLSLPLRCH